MTTGNDGRRREDIDPLAERIAQAIEALAEHEGVRAQRVIQMCAHVAREEGRKR